MSQLNSFTKGQLVEVTRKLGLPVGDYARASKEGLVANLTAVEAQAIAILTNVPQVAAPVATAVSPMAFVAPTYDDIRPVRVEEASKVFGVRSKLLAGLMVEVWNDPAAPAVMAGFKFDAERLLWVLTNMLDGGNTWLAGPAGTGKTEFIKQIAARLGRNFVRVQFDASLEAYHIIGGERVKSASTIWNDGLVLSGFRRPGSIILLDEVGFARSEYTSSLHAALEPRATITVTETNEVVFKAPGVVFCAADNSNGRGDSTGNYVGIREQNQAFLSRFDRFVEFDYLPLAQEVEIVMVNASNERRQCSASLAQMVVEFIHICRAKAETAALSTPPTMREAFYLCRALMDRINPRKAFELTVVNRSYTDCQEVLQQLWAANINEDLVSAAIAGEDVVLLSKVVKVDTPPVATAVDETNPF